MSADDSYGRNSATETENRRVSIDASKDDPQMDIDHFDNSEYHAETSQSMKTLSMSKKSLGEC